MVIIWISKIQILNFKNNKSYFLKILYINKSPFGGFRGLNYARN